MTEGFFIEREDNNDDKDLSRVIQRLITQIGLSLPDADTSIDVSRDKPKILEFMKNKNETIILNESKVEELQLVNRIT